MESHDKKPITRSNDFLLFWRGLFPIFLGGLLTAPWVHCLRWLGYDSVAADTFYGFPMLAPLWGGVGFCLVALLVMAFKREPLSQEQRELAKRATEDDLNILFLLPAFMGVMICLGIWAYQVYSYLQTGEWPGLSLVSGLQLVDMRWALYPNSWLGVYKILESMPLSFASVGTGILLSYGLFRLRSEVKSLFASASK